jgi:hypothetical protein
LAQGELRVVRVQQPVSAHPAAAEPPP